MKQGWVFVSLILAAAAVWAQRGDFPVLTGPYLGQTPPEGEQVLFAPGIVSTEAGNHSSVTIRPDGTGLYWEMKGKIWFTELENNRWTRPEMVSFCSGDSYMYGNPFVTPDGKKLFFTSFRPGAVSQDKENIWYVERTATGWSDPVPVSADVNSLNLHWSISVSKTGTLYFQSQDATGKSSGGIGDICYSRRVDGVYTTPVAMGSAINTRHTETCPYIAPDESYIIFNRFDHTVMENSGIYISFRDKSDGWLPAVMAVGGSPDKGGVSPKVSPEGKYLFFANGSDGVWWMPAGMIDELRPRD
jgi:hypothetical protein